MIAESCVEKLRMQEDSEMEKSQKQEQSRKEGIIWDEVEILVVGAGTMGASITQAYAQSGFNVGFIDINEEIIQKAFATIDRELEEA
ncbi:MAG: 3-hydroxyacyl-CoA dehydrogenase NAD-binding domain-containing protein, partial [Candidatus Aminicenantales bacterium]